MTETQTLDRILVPIDVSKYFHKAMIMGPDGEVIQEPFEIDIYQEGLEKLVAKVKEAKNGGNPRVIFALEPTSYYHQTLMENLKGLGHEIQLINPYTTAKVRALDHVHIKTDDLDVKTLGRAVNLGKGKSFVPRSKANQKLRAVTRQRWTRTNTLKGVKTQIHKHIDALWPGFVNRFQREKGLVWNIWDSQMAWAILQLCPDPRKVSHMAPRQLCDLFHKHGVRGVVGPKRALRIIEHAQSALRRSFYLPEIRNNLKQDLQLIHHLNTIVSDLENRAVRLLPEEAKYLLSIKGITPFYAAAFLAEIEDIGKFASPKQLIKYAGLDISFRASGLYHSRENHLTKDGNRYLRYVTMTMARNAARCHPDFKARLEKFTSRGKPYPEAVGCVATKLLKVFFSLLSRKEVFSSDKFANLN